MTAAFKSTLDGAVPTQHQALEFSCAHLIVSTMDAFVKWRAGETKGYIHRFLERLKVTLFCMEEYESYDVSQVIAALSNFHAQTLLMVGDVHQRVENKYRGRRVDSNGEGSLGNLKFARYGLEDDTEQYDAAQPTSDVDSGTLTVPEARPWYEWCQNAEEGVLDHCKRCGSAVCDYVKHCLHTITKSYTSDPAVAYETVLEHVFFDGNRWCTNPLHQGEEVGWHDLLFQALCHVVIRDVKAYKDRHPDTPMSKLPRPTVLIVMPLSRSAIPLCVLLQEVCGKLEIPDDVVRISLPLNIRGESFPIVHCVRHRRTLEAWDQYAGTQRNLNQEYINLTRGVEKTCMWLEKQPFGHPSSPWKYAPWSVHVDKNCASYAVERNAYLQEKKDQKDLKWYLLEQHDSIAKSYRTCFKTELDEPQAQLVSGLAGWIRKEMQKGKWKGLPKLGQDPSDFRSLDEVLSHVVDGMGTSVSHFVGEGTHGLWQVGHGSAANRWDVDAVDKKVTRKVDICDWKAAMQFGHLLLPCATAEISSQAEKGTTRLCFPFLQVSEGFDPENAIASLCCLTWYLAFRLESSLVTTARLHLIPHKMTLAEFLRRSVRSTCSWAFCPVSEACCALTYRNRQSAAT